MQTGGLTSWATDSLVDEFYVKLWKIRGHSVEIQNEDT